ncbi:MAG TPA: inositol monophosphatase family protein [Spirochaetia bacterium]|nr:inositol monophosphatase family protein [Spirochaetia bacterium]
MKLSPDELRPFRQFAESLAEEAGRISLNYFRKAIDVETKADLTPVTRADRETEQFIRSSIAHRFPGHLITGEEFGTTIGNRKPDNADEAPGSAVADSPFRWVVDPIDGTKAFVLGVPLYTTLIALLYNEQPVVGIIHNPVLGETASASVGGGCTLNGASCKVSTCSSLAEARVHSTDYANLARREPDFARLLLEEAGSARTWADAYGYLLVASGRADVMIDPVMSPWDIAPLGPIIGEAGGELTALDGTNTWTGESALATNGTLHRQILDLKLRR